MFTQFKVQKSLVKRFSSNIVLTDLSSFTVPVGHTLVSKTGYIENLRITSFIRTLSVTDTNSIDDIEDPDAIRAKLVDILFHSPRKQLDISVISDNTTTLLGSLSLINNGFPYNFNDVSDIINNRLSLDNITSLKLDFIDAGYGLMILPDYCLIQGDIVQEITLFKETPTIINATVSPTIVIPTPTINLTIKGITGGGGEPDPEPEPELTLEELMRLHRLNAWYVGLQTYLWNWSRYPANYLSISPFIISDGYDLTDVGFFVRNMPDGNYLNIEWTNSNAKIAIWDDVNGSPNFAAKLTDGVIPLTRQQNYDVNFYKHTFPLPVTGKKLVWVGIKLQDLIYQTYVYAASSDFNQYGFDMPSDLMTDCDPYDRCYTGYGVPNTPYTDAWGTSYTIQASGTGFNPDDESPIAILGKLVKAA